MSKTVQQPCLNHIADNTLLSCNMLHRQVASCKLAIMVLMIGLSQTACQTVTDGQSRMPSADPKAAALTRTALASEFLQKNQLDAAQRSLDLALKADPDCAEAYNMMGVLLQREGSPLNHAKAESHFKQAIKLQPDFSAAYNNYGVYLRESNRLPEAISAFETAGSALGYESRGQALENLGRTALLLGDIPKAKNAFTRAIQTDSNSAISHFELAEIYFQERNVVDASSEFSIYQQLLGNQKMGARSLWLGIRIASAQSNTARVQAYAQQLSQEFPNSRENAQSLNLLQGIMKSWQ